jgi:thioesterase domain-containing protein
MRYRLRPYAGKAVAFLARENQFPQSRDPRLALVREFLPQGEVVHIDGTHAECMHKPHVDRLAETLGEYLIDS